MPFLRTFLLAIFVAAATAGSAAAAELLMYRRAGCPWCAAWDRQVGPVYGKTDIGKRVPVRMIDLDEPQQPGLSLASPVRFTPTFVLVENGREIARIEGYPGEDFFWELLGRHMLRLPSSAEGGLSVSESSPPSGTRPQ